MNVVVSTPDTPSKLKAHSQLLLPEWISLVNTNPHYVFKQVVGLDVLQTFSTCAKDFIN